VIRKLYKKIHNKLNFPGLAIHSSVLLKNNGRFSYGTNCAFDKDSTVLIGGELRLGSNVLVLKDTEISAEQIEIGSNISIQKHSYIFGNVKIGSYCIFGPNLYISSGIHTFKKIPFLNIHDQELLEKDQTEIKTISIGEDCWFGINVVILPGVTIGKGCIVGANSVVNKDILPYSIVAGAPAKVVSRRLEFLPPKKILSTIDYIPYFYSGFNTKREDISEEGISLLSKKVEVFIDQKDAQSLNFKVSGATYAIFESEKYYVETGSIKIRSDLFKNPIKLEFDKTEYKNIKIKEIWVI
jgi:acetyltransferase-like isoleucine patch superfamily enzyme